MPPAPPAQHDRGVRLSVRLGGLFGRNARIPLGEAIDLIRGVAELTIEGREFAAGDDLLRIPVDQQPAQLLGPLGFCPDTTLYRITPYRRRRVTARDRID